MNPQQLKLYAITDRSWLKPGETLTEVVETLLKAGVMVSNDCPGRRRFSSC